MSNYAKLVEKSKAHWENFNPDEYILEKAKAINEYLRRDGLDAVVIGISGGIDSAVCLKLLELAAKLDDSPLKAILPVSIPIVGSIGTTGQGNAVRLANLLVPGIEVIHVGEASNLMYREMTTDAMMQNEFVKGQLDYWLRPAILYGKSAYLRSTGFESVVCGTINACEKFLGFYGYHTDPCDFCPITDLVKSQVFKVAKVLGVPEEIINAKPSGGVYTGQTDEELFEGTYEAVEAYMHLYLNTPPFMWDEAEDCPEFKGILAQRASTRFKRRRQLDTVEV